MLNRRPGDAGQTSVSASPKICPFGASKKSASQVKMVCAKGEVVIAMWHIGGGEGVSVESGGAGQR
jgi:hypothetical protein